jgi:hypothetical protein
MKVLKYLLLPSLEQKSDDVAKKRYVDNRDDISQRVKLERILLLYG